MVLYWPIFGIRPVVDDNMYPLAWVDRVPASQLLAGDPGIYPEWRPLPYSWLWLEHRLVDLRAVPLHFAVNLALWLTCVVLVHRLVVTLSGSSMAGALGALFLLTDPRATWALVLIIERQTTMACAFGLAALLVVVRVGPRQLSRAELIVVTGLLVGAALSKEYGLAFAFGLVAWAAVNKQGRLLQPALAACAIYAVLRMTLAGGAVAPYCERMYFFFDERRQCVDLGQSDSLAQMAYNAIGTALNLVSPGWLSTEGRPVFAKQRLITSAILLLPMAIAFAKGAATVRLMAFVGAATVLLNVPMYHDRNQLAGACMAAVIAGVGMERAWRLAGDRATRLVGVGAIVLALLLQTVIARRVVAQHAADFTVNDPCDTDFHREQPEATPFIARIKTAYGMSDPFCEGR